MIGGKYEELYDIIRITDFFFNTRNSRILFFLQEECGKQLATSLLMTHDYFKNYQLVSQH